MEIGNNKIETLNGKTLWTPKEIEKKFENVTVFKEYIPSDADISNKMDELLGKPTLIDELTKLAIKDEQERYIRELLIRNKELQAEVEEANESVTWWNNRFNAVNRDKTLYKHRINTANEYIESRKENMIPEHYNDLKYILNECDLESSW